MAKSQRIRVPSYRHHKPSGQAVVTLCGKDFYLGPHGTRASKAEYDRLVGEWQANGRQLPNTDGPGAMTVNDLMLAYWRFAETYYVKNGEPTSEQYNMRWALRYLKKLYGRRQVKDFGPLGLKACRQAMIEAGLSRGVINHNMMRIKRVFRWGVENQLVPPNVYHGLQAVSGLRRGRSEARETEPVGPVPDAWVDAVRPFVSSHVWAMIELQRLTGMRSGEAVIMRGCDLDMTGRIWVYQPQSHKTEHHGIDRPIYLGPKAQDILRPFLKTDLSAFLFSPRESKEAYNQQRRANRKSPMTPSQAKRRPKRNPKRAPRDRYDTAGYRRAIQRACDQAFPPPTDLDKEAKRKWRRDHSWHPHQLRHNCATRLRKEYGIEAARVVLGHRSSAVTEIYAEIDHAKAADVMWKVG